MMYEVRRLTLRCPFARGNKRYEMGNDLGNVLATDSAKHTLASGGIDTMGVVRYFAEVMTAQDYYPFGSTILGRVYDADTAGFRCEFSGKEADAENGRQYNYGFRANNTYKYKWMIIKYLPSR